MEAWVNQIAKMMVKRKYLEAIQPCVQLKFVIINLPIVLGP